jgi:hypothetical protein
VQAIYRFVDPELRIEGGTDPDTLVTVATARVHSMSDSASTLPSATIQDETRYVLAAPEQRVLAYETPIRTADLERHTRPIRVGAAFPGAERLVLVPQFRDKHLKRGETLPTQLQEIEMIRGHRMVRLELPSEPSGLGENSVLFVRAYRPVLRTSHSTREVEIPPGARLEFAMGILESGPSEVPVRFSIEACGDGYCDLLFAEVLDPSAEGASGWQDRALSLESLAGTVRSLRFRTEPPGQQEAEFSLPVWANPTLLALVTGSQRPRNVILLSIDTLRRDHLDVYGYSRETAPFVRSRLAREGVVFENLIAEATTTDPSHMTMFTSLPSLVHGASGASKLLAVRAVTLAEILRDRGFQTAAFTENGPLAHDRGFGIGFDQYHENKSALLWYPTGQVDRTFSQAREWLTHHADQPFFLFLHTFQVHAPYAPPREYQAYFADSSPNDTVITWRRRPSPATKYD